MDESNNADNGSTMKNNTKDSVFRDLFSDPKNTFRLYKTLHPEDADATVSDINNVTIQNVFLNAPHNDLGFMVRDQLIILVEEQSSWSDNIVVRLFLYFAFTLKQYIDENNINLYSSTPIEMPLPEFYVLYAGPTPEKIKKKELSLKEDILHGADSDLDVRAKIIVDDNSDSIIGEYTTFTKILYGQVAIYGKTKKAVEETIRICESQNVLHEYLSGREKEVINMVDLLFDQERQVQLYGDERAKNADAIRIVNSVESIAANFNLSIDDACKGMNISRRDYEEAKTLIERASKKTLVGA